MFERRDVLKIGLGSLAAGILWPPEGAVLAQSAPSGQPAAPAGFAFGNPTPFQANVVKDAARALAKSAFKPVSADLPASFRNLSYDQYVAIRGKPGTALWINQKFGFALEPLHRGFIFSSPVEINIVTQGQARHLIYDPSLYDFGKLAVRGDIGDIGFSGFRVLTPQDGKGFAEIATFQGASFFRAVAEGQNPGTMARALSIKTADPHGEEFPMIRSYWIEQPTLADDMLVIHALIDSESVSGAYRFTLRPGEATIIDTECTLYPRVNVDNFGLATMSATVVSDAIDHRRPDDTRPIIAEIGGIQMSTGKGEWIWRPASNRDTLQISTFVDEHPRGFGFLQRDRRFDRYQDDDQHWELRPSLWIEPIGDWSAGGVQLIEIPSESETNDNIIAYWRPQQALIAGNETSFAYRQFWCWEPPDRPPLAIVTDTRSGHGSGGHRRRFLVEFTGDRLGDVHESQSIKAVLSASPGTIISTRQFPMPNAKVYRVLFELDPGNEAYSEMRLVLEAADGKPLSETWLYRWTR
ncbi:MAG TPA: glucan biosynthesis protein [Methylovirgula sp.]|nr:glucan biosynthesis protein [Methylovirgula sp.]